MAWLFLIVVCGVATLCNLDSHLHRIACGRYSFLSPIEARAYLLRFYIYCVRTWLKEYIKKFWAWCKKCIESLENGRKYLLVSIRKYPAIAIAYMLFLSLSFVFGLFFYSRLYPLIESLYELTKYQIANISIGDRAFRNASLSIAGSITLLITLLGVLLTLIRNLLIFQQNKTDEERLVTEQISRAIDQIGAYKQTTNDRRPEPNMEVRLGGLYSLQRIMKNSPKDEDSIAKIFYSYVNENIKKNRGEP